MILEEYAQQAFGDNPRAPAFFLKEVADPGAFDRLAAALAAETEAEILCRGAKRSEREQAERQGKHRRSPPAGHCRSSFLPPVASSRCDLPVKMMTSP